MDWLTTKKRGRDDDKIASAKKRALELRRSKKTSSVGLKNSKTSKKNSVAKSKTTKKRRNDDESEDSFIDDSDGEEEEEVDEESLVDDDELSADEISFDSAEDPSGSESDDQGTFLPKSQKRTSKPSSVFKKIALSSGAKTTKLSSQKPMLDFKKSNIKNGLKTKQSDVGKISNNLQKHVHPIVSNTSSVNSKIPMKPEKHIILSDDSSFESASALFRDNGSKKSSGQAISPPKRPLLDKPKDLQCADDLEDTPVRADSNSPQIKRNFKKIRKRIIVDDDESDDDVQIVSNPLDQCKAPQTLKSTVASVSKNAFTADDYCSDDHEAIALSIALDKSSGTGKGKKSSHSNSSKNKPTYKEDLEEDEPQYTDKDDDDDDKVEFMDEDTAVAMSVLETANGLSAQVLQNMIRWTRRHSTSSALDDKNEDTSIPMGMIVDGAVAMSSLGDGDSSNIVDSESCSTWISNETMKTILPNAKLADYQLIGVNWMSLLHNMKCELKEGPAKGKKSLKQKSKKPPILTNVNGVLADDMGLGKTVQTIAFLSWLNHQHVSQSTQNGVNSSELQSNGKRGNSSTEMKPHLIVSPASVVTNWEREFHKFAPHMKVVKYYGSIEERNEIQHYVRSCLGSSGANDKDSSFDNRVDVILCPVTTFEKEKGDDRSFLRSFKYEYLVVDEAHLLKNARGNRYKQLQRVKSNHRLLLTGTPVQNSPKELMALLCFLMPLFSKPAANDHDDEGGSDGGENMLQHFVSLEKNKDGIQDDQAAYRKLKQLFSPFVLRRRKEDVLSQILPPKERRVEFVQLDPRARKLYDSIIAEHVEAKKMSKKLNFEHLFTELRKAAHHPLLIRSRFKEPLEREQLAKDFLRYGAFRGDACNMKKVSEELKKFSDFEIHLTAHSLVTGNPDLHKELGQYLLCEEDLFCSAKFAKLRILLPDLVSKGHRILIFSGWTTVLDLLTCLMDSLNLNYMRMDGQTDVSERQDLIDTFNNDASIPVFLLSTRASGLGITLTSAQICIMHDLDFNPFNDLQAEDRCHRIGQTKKVTVVKLVAEGTVDEDVYAMQERKAKMHSAIMTNETEWKKESKKAKDVIIKTAMNRYLTQHEEVGTDVALSNVDDQSAIKCEKTSLSTDRNGCGSYNAIDIDLL